MQEEGDRGRWERQVIPLVVLQQVLAGPVCAPLPVGSPVSGRLLAETIDTWVSEGWRDLQGGFYHHSTTMETTIHPSDI